MRRIVSWKMASLLVSRISQIVRRASHRLEVRQPDGMLITHRFIGRKDGKWIVSPVKDGPPGTNPTAAPAGLSRIITQGPPINRWAINGRPLQGRFYIKSFS